MFTSIASVIEQLLNRPLAKTGARASDGREAQERLNVAKAMMESQELNKVAKTSRAKARKNRRAEEGLEMMAPAKKVALRV